MKKRCSVIFLILAAGLILLASYNEAPPVDTPIALDTTAATDTAATPDTTAVPDITAAPETEPPVKLEPKLPPFSQLNRGEREADDHEGEYSLSSIELDYRSVVELLPYQTGTNVLYYPRIKQLKNGTYMLLFESGANRGDIVAMFSEDLKNWSGRMTIEKEHPMPSEGGTRRYATADAVVLENGDILVCCSFRSSVNKLYQTDMSTSGLALRRSKDNGKTWSEQEIVYYGMNWEPSLLEADNGEIFIMFTQTAPYVYTYYFHPNYRSSGSAIIRSNDGGYTWTPKVEGPPYCAQRVMQVYMGDLDGLPKMNDQMPVMLQLNNGTIAVCTETRRTDLSHGISIGYFHDYFEESLEMFEIGPKDRKTDFINGTGPYLAQFKSGETLLTYATRARIGDNNARVFNSEIVPHKNITSYSLWESTEVIDTHSVIITLTNKTSSYSTVGCAVHNLNHRIDAESAAIEVNGISNDWYDTDDALFLGSESQAQASFRVKHDENNLYFLVDRYDKYLAMEDDTVLFLALEGEDKDHIRLAIDPSGKVTATAYSNGKSIDITKHASFSLSLLGSFDDSDEDEGYLAEISLSKAVFKADGGFRFCAVLINKDGKELYPVDIMESATELKKWQRVVLK